MIELTRLDIIMIRTFLRSLMPSFSMLLLSMLIPTRVNAVEYLPLDTIPTEVKGFVEPGTLPIALEKADLNGDGREDFILVLEPAKQAAMDSDGVRRPLLILVRENNGALKLAKRNDKIILCSTCGGVMGDPFQGIEAGLKNFEVFHYGGSRERWSIHFKFSYSRRDDTWQLVRVIESSFDAFDPETEEKAVYTPPGDYGKIDITDVDPDDWKGRGAR